MAIVFFALGIALVIVYFAARMVAGWIVGREAIAKWDAFAATVFAWAGKILLLAIAGLIIYFAYTVYSGMPK